MKFVQVCKAENAGSIAAIMNTQDSKMQTETIKDARDWSRVLSAYRDPDERQTIREILATVVPFFSLWVIAANIAATYPVIALLLSIPIGFFLMRIFCIQHDCSHYSLFKNRKHNVYLGRAVSLFTLTPFAVWQRMHDVHHANSGNLECRDLGEVTTLTVREYQSRSPFSKLIYRIYRHPFFLFGAAPFLLFFLQYRLPFGLMRHRRYWLSAMGLNLSLVLWITILVFLTGWQSLVWVLLPSTLIGATAGVFTFYVQHQFENSHWSRPPDWQVHNAALQGSSFVEMPRWLAWFTADISIHHVHHLYARIPFYRLKEVIDDYPALAEVNRISFRESFKSVHFHLWDDIAGKMISFRDLDHDTAGLSVIK